MNKTCFTLRVKVTPNARRTAYCGLIDGLHKFRIAAPPEKGKANKILIDFLSEILQVGKNQIFIQSGQTQPLKTVIIEGISERDALSKIQAAKVD